jgi:hypothetical protein
MAFLPADALSARSSVEKQLDFEPSFLSAQVVFLRLKNPGIVVLPESFNDDLPLPFCFCGSYDVVL